MAIEVLGENSSNEWLEAVGEETMGFGNATNGQHSWTIDMEGLNNVVNSF